MKRLTHRTAGHRPATRTPSVLEGLPRLVLPGLPALFLAGSLAGQTIRSTSYDGTSGARVTHEHRPEHDPGVPITIEAWVYRRDAGRCETIVSRGFRSSYWFGFCPRLRFYRSGSFSADSPETVPAGQWTHVAVSYDGTTARFYIDGQAAGAVPLAHAGSGHASPLWVGSEGGSFPLDGALDEVRIWSAARSQSQIRGDMRREVRAAPGLVAAFPEGGVGEAVAGTGGTAGPGATTQVFGVLPRDLRVPQAPFVPVLDGVVGLEGEYAGAEQLVLLYHDGERAPDAVAYLVYTDGPADRALYVGVKGIRPTIGSWQWENSWVSLLIDPDSGRDVLAQADDFQIGNYLGAAEPDELRVPFWLVGDGRGAYEPCTFIPEPPLPPVPFDCTPGSDVWGVATSICRGEFEPPCMEFRIDLSVFRDRSVPDGFAIGHFWVGGIGDDDFGPDDARWNSPATWASLSFVEGSASLPVADFAGRVLDGGRPVAGHRVFLMDRTAFAEIARTTTAGDGAFSFRQPVPAGHELSLLIEECDGCRYLAPVLGATGISPSSAGSREVIFPGCSSLAGCFYRRVDFRVDTTPPVEVMVLGVEINQSVQNEVFVPDGPGTIIVPSEGVPLVAGKEALVRYYLAGRGGARPGYRAELSVVIGTRSGETIRKTIAPNTGRPSVDVPPDPASASGRRQLVYELRPDLSRTLDFVVPGEDLEDAEFLQVNLSTVPRLAGAVQVFVFPPVELAINAVQLAGPGLGTPPDLGDIDDAVIRYLRAAYPVRDVEVLSVRRLSLGSYRTRKCRRILWRVWRVLGGDDAPVRPSSSVPVWAPTVGFATALPDCLGMAYMGGTPWRRRDGPLGGTAITQLFGDTAAQEIGHTLGLRHAGRDHGESGAEDWPYPHGSLGPDAGWGNFGAVLEATREPAGPGDPGEWDVSLIDPCPAADVTGRFPTCGVAESSLPHDFMSYGSTATAVGSLTTSKGRWISDVTYWDIYHEILTSGLRSGGGGGVAEGMPGEGRVEALLVDGEILEDGTIELLPLLRKPMPASLLEEAISDGEPAYVLEVLDAAGRVLYSRRFQSVEMSAHDEEVQAIREVIPYIEGMRRLRFLEGGAVAGELLASEHAPFVEVLSPAGGEVLDSGTHRVVWTGGDEDGDPVEYLIQYSPDGGRSWQGIGLVDQEDAGELEFSPGELIPGAQALIRIAASDGFHTTVATSEGFFCTGQCDLSRPERPRGLVATARGGEIELEWEPNAPGGPFFSGYNVYRSAGSGGPYRQINLRPSWQNRFTDRADLEPGVTYCYVVRAVGSGGTVSPPSTEACTAVGARERFKRGDADASGGINLADAIAVLDVLFRGRGVLECQDAADADDSGDLNLTDPVFLLRWLFRGGEAPPPPGPRTCGPDPTADALPACTVGPAGC